MKSWGFDLNHVFNLRLGQRFLFLLSDSCLVRLLSLLELLRANDFESPLNSFASILIRIVHERPNEKGFKAIKLIDLSEEKARLPYNARQQKIK